MFMVKDKELQWMGEESQEYKIYVQPLVYWEHKHLDEWMEPRYVPHTTTDSYTCNSSSWSTSRPFSPTNAIFN